jgi:class 3 adenylate cyclase
MAVVLFTDVVDSVPFTERLGDLKARELFDRLHVDMTAAIEDCGGTMVEGVNLGDGLLSTFTSARQAIDAAIRCRTLAGALGIELHVGLHAGDILRHGKQISGGTVNIAARVRDACPAGEIFVSGTVRDLARTSTSATFDDRGVHNLKGVSEAQRLYAVQPAQS